LIILKLLAVLIARLLYFFYKYEGINILFKSLPSNIIVHILRLFGAKIGKDVRIQAPFLIHNADQIYPIYSNLIIGDDCYIGRDCIFDLMDKITLGNQVTISHRAVLNTHTNAGKSPIANKKLINTSGVIKINDGAYLGSNITVLESVTIGEQSIIGACALVNKNIPKFVTAYGIPCKIIKELT
jgi:acetyltransferase-like isoleucine patch superfamily enzyme